MVRSSSARDRCRFRLPFSFCCETSNAACSLFDMDAIDSPEYVVPSGPSELAAAVFSELGQLRCDGPCESASAAAVGNGCFCGFLDDLTDSQNGLVPKREFALKLSATKRFSPPKIDAMYAAYAENKLLEQSEGKILNLQKEGERLAEKARSGSLEDMQAFNQNVQQRTALMDEIDRQLSRAVNAK